MDIFKLSSTPGERVGYPEDNKLIIGAVISCFVYDDGCMITTMLLDDGSEFAFFHFLRPPTVH